MHRKEQIILNNIKRFENNLEKKRDRFCELDDLLLIVLKGFWEARAECADENLRAGYEDVHRKLVRLCYKKKLHVFF